MKNLSLVLATVVAFLMVLPSGNAWSVGDPDTKTLKLKTEVSGKHKADIMVFAWDETSSKWVKTLEQNHKKKSNMYLDPEVDYQIWFTSADGLTKVLHIERGEAGAWYEEVVVDFNDKSNRYARFYQKNWNYGYAMERVSSGYRNSDLLSNR